MAKTTIGFAIALILLGVGSYFATGMRSPTALIPALAGLLLGVCGIVALNPNLRMHAIHGAVLLALIGFAASVPGVVKLVSLLTHGEQAMNADQRTAAGLKPDQVRLTNGKDIRPVAVYCQTGMAAILAPFIVLCVKSFVDARKARKAAAL